MRRVATEETARSESRENRQVGSHEVSVSGISEGRWERVAYFRSGRAGADVSVTLRGNREESVLSGASGLKGPEGLEGVSQLLYVYEEVEAQFRIYGIRAK